MRIPIIVLLPFQHPVVGIADCKTNLLPCYIHIATNAAQKKFVRRQVNTLLMCHLLMDRTVFRRVHPSVFPAISYTIYSLN